MDLNIIENCNYLILSLRVKKPFGTSNNLQYEWNLVNNN